jgi:hypothetical protein
VNLLCDMFEPTLIASCVHAMLDIQGYVLEALDVIEVPPEPPEQVRTAIYISALQRFTHA